MSKHDLPILPLVACAAILLAFTGGCSMTRVDSDYGPAIKMQDGLGPYYAWRPGFDTRLGESTSPYYEVKAFIRDAIDQGLQERGFMRSTSEPADFWVDFGLCIRTQGDPYDQFIQYEMGTLVVLVSDPVSRDRIWRGWAEMRVRRSASPEERRERICDTVDRILKRFAYKPCWVEETVIEPGVEVEVVPEIVPHDH